MRLKVFLMLLLVCGALVAAPAFTLSKDKPLQIATAQDATPAEKLAATELHDYILKLCGADCQITNENDVLAEAIYLGWTEAAKRAVGDLSKLGEEEWFVKTNDASLIITGGRPRGTLYAVYEFLERQGIVWADETTEFVPSLDAIVLEAPLSIQDKPSILGRNVYTSYHMPSRAATMFYIRNKLNHYHTIFEQYGYGFSMGRPQNCHTFHAYTKPEWPDEWFMMDANGKRIRSTTGAGPGQLCLTNPELRKAMVERLKEFIAADRKDKSPYGYPRIYDISQNDNPNYCLCPNCKALAEREGGNSGPMIDFVNSIANAVAKDYPEILIQTFAYTWTLDAPKTIKPAKNVMIRVCKLGGTDTMSPNTHPRNKRYYENFKKWAAISENIAVWDYWITYNGERMPPFINLPTMQQDIKFYTQNHVKTMFVEFENPLHTSFTYFRIWYGLKLMQNPSQPYGVLADKFFKTYYGAAAKPMRNYMEYLQEMQTASDAFIDTCTLTTKIIIPHNTKNKIKPILPYLDKEFFEMANALLDSAEQLAAGDAKSLEHVKKERIPVDIALLHSMQQYVGQPLPVGKMIEGKAEALAARYASNIMGQARKFFDSNIYHKNPKMMKELEEYNANLLTVRQLDEAAVIPPQFKDKECIYLKADDRHGVKVHDEDAPSKYPQQLINDKAYNFHRLPFTMGIYNKQSRFFQTSLSIPQDKIPQDGKFHWYHLGRFNIKPASILWVHWTWTLQMSLDGASFGGENGDECDVYALVKLTGKPYIKGSEDEPKVLFDAVMFVK